MRPHAWLVGGGRGTSTLGARRAGRNTDLRPSMPPPQETPRWMPGLKGACGTQAPSRSRGTLTHRDARHQTGAGEAGRPPPCQAGGRALLSYVEAAKRRRLVPRRIYGSLIHAQDNRAD
ncbi:hypothetical protein H1C71_036240 [Ictidomys tridecemlineatus]|nr:hypothetical protein H1C71_036240 [Ictidomys tridecemlineatus]